VPDHILDWKIEHDDINRAIRESDWKNLLQYVVEAKSEKECQNTTGQENIKKFEEWYTKRQASFDKFFNDDQKKYITNNRSLTKSEKQEQECEQVIRELIKINYFNDQGYISLRRIPGIKKNS
jgi:hypothetical protein